MRFARTAGIALLGVVFAACADAGTTATTLQEALDEAAGEVAAAVSAAQEDLAELGEAIENSDASQELQAAWEEARADLTEMLTSLQSEGTVDRERVEEILQSFRDELEAAGDEIGPELLEAWESLRARIEALIE